MIMTGSVRAVWCVATITVTSSEISITTRTTAVNDKQESPAPAQFRWSPGQVRDVLGGIIMAGDVVHQTIPVTRERETVTGLVMEVNMTGTVDVKEIWCVVATTVGSSDCIIMRRMTAVRGPQ